MEDFGVEFIGLDEFAEDIHKALTDYPDEMNRFMRRQGTAFAKDVRDKMPPHWKNGKRAPGKAKEWHRDVYEDTSHHVNHVEIKCKSPHWHMLENGHIMVVGSRKKKNLKKVGYVKGFHYAEKTREEWKEKFPDNIVGFTDELLKAHNL